MEIVITATLAQTQRKKAWYTLSMGYSGADCNSIEDAYVLARRLIRVRLASPTPTQQEFIESVGLEDSQRCKPYKTA